MAVHNLALILRDPYSNDAKVLLVQQPRPAKLGEQDYDSHVDSDLWDLPSTVLKVLEAEYQSGVVVEGAQSCSDKLPLKNFDINAALKEALGQAGFQIKDLKELKFHKYIEEPEFGPGPPVNTVFIEGNVVAADKLRRESCKWMSLQRCISWLVDVKPSGSRVGPLVVLGLLNDLMPSARKNFLPNLHYQEYPPGVHVIPMRSRTAKPFSTTNLVVFAPEKVSDGHITSGFITNGEALIVDPGCRSDFSLELMKIIAALPRKLIVFLTHHHRDHVDGLSVVQRCNPDAILLAHENTLRRIQKGDWSAGYVSISKGGDVLISGHRLSIIFAPGHTDGHMALLHVGTNSLIVGDHCVGKGSALLDITSGGNMSDYFQTTYKFMELSPHNLIPMHGRINLWPKDMLCKYLKNRRSREASILDAIKDGAETLYEIIEKVYSDVDLSLRFAAAYNVRLHVEHLAQNGKLPEGFSIQKFQRSCGVQFCMNWRGLCFLVRYGWVYISNITRSLLYKQKRTFTMAVAGFVAVFTILYTGYCKSGSSREGKYIVVKGPDVING